MNNKKQKHKKTLPEIKHINKNQGQEITMGFSHLLQSKISLGHLNFRLKDLIKSTVKPLQTQLRPQFDLNRGLNWNAKEAHRENWRIGCVT